MTQIQAGKFLCSCGNSINITNYGSVNINVDPELKSKVAERLINNVSCEKCDKNYGLLFEFLYVDNTDENNKKWIWCYPEHRRNDQKKIRNNIKKEYEIYSKNPLKVLPINAIPEPKLVFGYDELLKIID